VRQVYVFKFFLWETGYWSSMDIAHDRAGFYTQWGCLVSCDLVALWLPSHRRQASHRRAGMRLHLLMNFHMALHVLQKICWVTLLLAQVWVPSVYTSPAMYLVRRPYDYPPLVAGELAAGASRAAGAS
jgi:hypothetical protein